MRDQFSATGEQAEKGYKQNLKSHYITTRHKLKAEIDEVESAKTTTLALATPQETEAHEELLRTTKDNIQKGEVRLKENNVIITMSYSRPGAVLWTNIMKEQWLEA